MCVLGIIAPAYYVNLITENAVNAPVWDDYDALLLFLNHFLVTDSVAGRMALVFIQHIEHRLVFLRLTGLTVFCLKGDLDFKWLCYIGNAGLVFLAYFLFSAFKSGRDFKLFYFTPVLFLLFQPQYHDTILWPTALIPNAYVLLFALMTIVWIERRSRLAFVLASIFSVLTILSQGNGILVFFVGLLALFLQRHYKRAAVWMLVSGLVLGGYFVRYTQMSGQAGVFSAFLNLKQTILHILCFAGSSLGFSSFYPSLICGIAIILYFVFLTVAKYYKDNPVLYSFFSFVLLSIGINALFRSGRGVEFVLSQSRYKFFSVFLVILVYLSLYEKVRGKRFHFYVGLVGVMAAMTFFIASINLYSSRVEGNSENLRRGLLRWYVEGKGLSYPFIEKASQILRESMERGVYRYPREILEEFSTTPDVFRQDRGEGNILPFIDTIAENDEYVYIDGWAFLEKRKGKKQRTRLVLKSPDHSLAFPTVTITRPDLVVEYLSRDLKDSGFGVLVRKGLIQPGRYEIGVYTEARIEDTVESGLWFSGKSIDIKK